MKIFKYIDFSVQTLLFVAVLVILIGRLGGSDTLLLVLWMQLLIGPWQVLSSVISVGVRARMYKPKTIHLIISALYLTVLFSFPLSMYSPVLARIIFMVPAWILAIYYFVLTCLATFQRRGRQSSFLPHTSF